MKEKGWINRLKSKITLIFSEDSEPNSKYCITRVAVYSLILYLFVLNLVTSSEQTYQVPKDYYFYRAVIIFFLFLFLVRGKKIVSGTMLITVTIGIVIMIGIFAIKRISPMYYGPLYFKVILFSWIILILFLAFIVNSVICARPKKCLAFYKAPIMFSLVFVIPLFFNKRYLLPVIMPILAFMLSDIPQKKLRSAFQGLAIGYYLAFLHMMAKSFIIDSERYESGRFLGSFGQVESGGMFCAGAVVCVLYFIFYLNWKGIRDKVLYCILFVLLIPPVYSTIIISSRSAELALFVMMIMGFIFMCGKGSWRATIIRGLVGIGIVGGAVLILVGLSLYWNRKASHGELSNVSYLQAHVMVLTNQDYRSGYFGESSVLNVLDRAGSDRVKIWAESIKQISLKGHSYDFLTLNNGYEAEDFYIATPHNFPILWLINYGLIGGLIVIVWYVCVLIRLIYDCLNRDENYIFPMLWAFYCIGIFAFSCVNWTYPVGFIMLVLQGSISISANWKYNSEISLSTTEA